MTAPTPPSALVDLCADCNVGEHLTCDDAQRRKVGLCGCTSSRHAPEILSCGEDGEWMVAVGHVDFDLFLVAAKAEAKSLGYDAIADEDFPEPHHRWWRPILRSDCGDDEEFAWKQSEDWQIWSDNPSEDGAEPITYVRFDW